MRLCSITFKEQMKIQVGDGVRTVPPGKTISLVELGPIESYGQEHLAGVESKQIPDPVRIRRSIEDLNEMTTERRIRWFNDHYPDVSVIMIKSERLVDKLHKDKVVAKPAVMIESAAELKWDK